MLLRYYKAAKNWNEALPLGNGHLGVMAYGGVKHELLCLNEGTFWSGYPKDTLTEGFAETVAEARRLVFDGKQRDAEKLIEAKKRSVYTEAYEPVGNVELVFEKNRTSGYASSLNLSNGVAAFSYRSGAQIVTRTCFVSKQGNCLAYKIESIDGVNFSLHLVCNHRGKYAFDDGHVYYIGNAPDKSLPVYTSVSDKVSYDEGKAMAFAFGACVVNAGGNAAIRQEGNRIDVRGATDVVIYVSAVTGFKSFDVMPDSNPEAQKARCKATLEAAKRIGYKQLYLKHTADFAALMQKSSLVLGEPQDEINVRRELRRTKRHAPSSELITAYAEFAKYLYVSASSEDSQAMNLQGLWNDKLTPPWSSNYTVNINTQMNYWLADSVGLSECYKPFINLMKMLSVTGARAAEKMFNCRGFSCNHNVDIWGFCAPVGGDCVYAYYPMAGAWLTTMLYEHYRYTLDDGYLREVFPIIESASLFVLDYMTEKDGVLTACPSTSPEHRYHAGEGKLTALCRFSTLDLFTVKQLLTDYLSCCSLLSVKGQCKEEAIEALGKLPEVPINAEGRLQEWDCDAAEAEKGHRHLSMLIGAFPFGQIKYHTEDKKLRDAAVKAILRRVKGGSGYTGWSCGWMLCLLSRLHLTKEMQHYLQRIFKNSTYPNMFDRHPPFQIDGNFGAARGLIESLVQVEDDVIELMPLSLVGMESGAMHGICLAGGYSIDMVWQRKVVKELAITSKVSKEVVFRLKSPTDGRELLWKYNVKANQKTKII